ncbi:UPF0481 protein At3g47200-like [Rhodamnia argentea]|uniref:UPF0481 protein At3g47200-like n=1 Tax=Rhodamnia argentea TaxID=178133 RepID=A0A8B8PJB4_9MYRT|nr:UPF0481 protein At3g47200-like [Rhodamnia argentea]XP_048133644.1 UPF0481 protein At3g47200-like [Rhodamnia argentea]XP_048133645.1 UPF0481 protein At3g47200-like [Rhodamnia argentea]
MSQTVKEVAITIMTKINKLPPVSVECCIYRVPEKFRAANEEAYTPQVISIGPFHRDKTVLQPREEIKMKYLKGFLSRIKADLLACTRMIKELEDRIRQCYQENLTQGSDELVEIILVDAVFVVEVFIRNHWPEHRDENDEIFSKQWMKNGVFHDVLLLENQVPFFVLEELYNLTTLRTTVTFFKLSYEYFKDVLHGHELAGTRIQVRHLVDYVRALQLPSFPRDKSSKQAKKFELTRSAKELQEAGVKFRQAEGTSSVLDVVFRDGTLEMSHLIVHEWTEVYFRNMIAYEQCHHDYKYISSYAILMDSLIDTPDDIDILTHCGILENQLKSTDDVASLFNSLYKETMRESSQFFYSSQCESLNAYSRTWWHQCMAACYRSRVILKRDYFSNPWSGISVVVAVVLLVLTVVQTACSLMDTYSGDARRLFRSHK